MKVEVKKKNEINGPFEFPVLMENADCELLVLFMSDRHGIVVKNNEYWPIWSISNSWVSCYDKSEWKKFEGEITLKND